jgi:oligopeptide/dipeptide ABC transporter ATP-binding protein
MCQRVYVMYAGRIVEEATTEQLFRGPRHPYSAGLLAALPDIDTEREWLASMKGSLPDLIQPIPGCGFAERCERASAVCSTAYPAVVEIAPQHRVWCHNPLD